MMKNLILVRGERVSFPHTWLYQNRTIISNASLIV